MPPSVWEMRQLNSGRAIGPPPFKVLASRVHGSKQGYGTLKLIHDAPAETSEWEKACDMVCDLKISGWLGAHANSKRARALGVETPLQKAVNCYGSDLNTFIEMQEAATAMTHKVDEIGMPDYPASWRVWVRRSGTRSTRAPARSKGCRSARPFTPSASWHAPCSWPVRPVGLRRSSSTRSGPRVAAASACRSTHTVARMIHWAS